MDGHGMVYVHIRSIRKRRRNKLLLHELKIQVLNPVFILVQTELPLSLEIKTNQKKTKKLQFKDISDFAGSPLMPGGSPAPELQPPRSLKIKSRSLCRPSCNVVLSSEDKKHSFRNAL